MDLVNALVFEAEWASVYNQDAVEDGTCASTSLNKSLETAHNN